MNDRHEMDIGTLFLRILAVLFLLGCLIAAPLLWLDALRNLL